jgi:flagellar biogenesis protein FliO
VTPRLPLLSRLPRQWAVLAFVFLFALLAGLAWSVTRSPGPAAPAPTAPAGEFLARGYAELAEQPTGASPGGSLWDLFAAMLVPTVIVVVAAYATIRVLRSLNRRVAASVSQSQLLELVDTLSLAGSGVIHIVRVGERFLLVGAGQAGLSLLGELRPEEIALLREQRATSPLAQAVVPPFRDLLQSRLPRSWRVLESTPEETRSASPGPEPVQRFGFVPESADSAKQ